VPVFFLTAPTTSYANLRIVRVDRSDRIQACRSFAEAWYRDRRRDRHTRAIEPLSDPPFEHEAAISAALSMFGGLGRVKGDLEAWRRCEVSGNLRNAGVPVDR